MRYFLFFDAVRCWHGARRYPCTSGCHCVHDLPYHRFYHPWWCQYDHSSYSTRYRAWSTRCIDRHYLEEDRLCWLDAGVSHLIAYLERDPTSLRFLAL